MTPEQSARLNELAERGYYEPEDMSEDELAELAKLILIKNNSIH